VVVRSLGSGTRMPKIDVFLIMFHLEKTESQYLVHYIENISFQGSKDTDNLWLSEPKSEKLKIDFLSIITH